MSIRGIEDIYPLSPLQQGMLFHSLYAPEAGQHILQLTCTLDGALDRGCFEDCWRRVLARHPALRASFAWEELDEPLQLVHREVALPIADADWRELSAEEQKSALDSYLAADRRRGFVLTEAPLMRILLAQTRADSHILVWSCHHLLLDGWSLGLVLEECLATYAALTRDQTPDLAPARPYRDYIAWLKEQPRDQAETFWRDRLRGFTAPTSLPTLSLPGDAQDSAADPSALYGRQTRQLSAETSAALRDLARDHALTVNTLFQGAWALLLGRYSGARDVVFGTTVSGRPPSLPDVTSIVGMFINTQPVRAQIDPDASLIPWLQALQRDQAAARQHEYSSLVQIHGWSEIPRGQELFDTLLVFENYPTSNIERTAQGELAVRDLETSDVTSYAIDIDIIPDPCITLVASYDRQRFDDHAIRRLLGHYQHVLEQMHAHPDAALATLSALPDDERHQIVHAWNQRRADYPVTSSLQTCIAAQVARTPEAIAVAHGHARLTYEALRRRANHLAHQLVAEPAGVGPDVVVALLADRDIDLLVAILAVLEAGGAYLPLDPQQPAERLARILDQARAPVVVTAPAHRPLLDTATDKLDHPLPTILDLEALQRSLQTASPGDLPERSRDAHLAYVIFTSGSTGTPKGAMLEHRGKINHIFAMIDALDLGPDDVMAQTASQCFDISVWQLLAPLVIGARVEIIDTEVVREPRRLLAEVERTGVSVLEVVPSLLLAMIEELERMAERPTLERLRWLIPTGETLPPALCRRWLRLYPSIPLVNAYGPTETSDDTNLHIITEPPADHVERIPVGFALPNMTMYILDERLEPVPVGVPGELYIGGVCVGRGYLEDPRRTAAAYIPDPFAGVAAVGAVPGARLYRSGDLCRYLPDGNIEYLDRADFQVKIRGYRVEPGEVENALLCHPAVTRAAVVVRDDTGRDELVAYVSLRDTDDAALRDFLRERVPHYMVPAAIVALPALPQTPNGKIDREALPPPDRALSRRAATPPRTPLEAQIAAIWEAVLDHAPIGVHDDFFEVGGHSLLAIQVHSRLRDALHLELPLRSLFELPTIARIAEHIEAIRWLTDDADARDSADAHDEEREELEL